MDNLQSIGETILLTTKEDFALDNASTGTSPAEQEFMELTKIIKNQQGHRSQYWGHSWENPKLFVWYINWESAEDHAKFTTTKDFQSFQDGLARVFDFEAAGPINLYSRWCYDPTAAFKSPLTEIALFNLPNGSSQEAKRAIENAMSQVVDMALSIGKAFGASIGWVYEAKPHPHPGVELLYAVFGYEGMETHLTWREHPDGQKVGEIFGNLASNGIIVMPATMPGVNPDTGYFHAYLQEGK